MKSIDSKTLRRFARAIPFILWTLGGCQATGVHVRPEGSAATAGGLEQAIVFATEGGPLDALAPNHDTLTLADAVQRAVGTHPGIQAALSRVRIAQADSKQARLLPNPILQLTVRLPEGGDAPTIEAGLAADLLAAIQQPGRVRAADGRLRAEAAQAVTTVLDVIADVGSTYYAVQASQAALPLLEQRREIIVRLLELARSRLNAGEGSRLEVVTFDAERLAIEAEIDDLLLEASEQRLALGRLIGQPSGEVSWPVSEWSAPAIGSVGESAWITGALHNRPEIQRRVWELAALGEEVRLSRLGLLEGITVGVDAEKNGEWSAGPGVVTPLPFFDWGQARRQRVLARRIEARHLLTAARREVVAQVRVAAAAFNESIHELQRVRGELIPLQEQRRALAEAAFRAGQTDVTAVIVADQELAATQTRAVDLQRRNSEAFLRLERAVGGGGVAAALIASTPDATSRQVAPVTRPATTRATR